MPIVKLMPEPKIQFFTNAGLPLAGGKLYTYSPGTITTKLTYTDNTATATNTNPVILDAAGRAGVWLDGFYDMKLTDSADVTIWTVSNVSSIDTSGVNYSSSSYTTLADAVTAIGATPATFTIETPLLAGNSFVTIPSTLSVVAKKGGSVNTSGSFIVFNGSFDAGTFQVFTGGGTVLFDNPSVAIAQAEWFSSEAAAKNAAGSHPVTNSTAGRTTFLANATTTYDELAGTMARVLALDSNGDTLTIPANTQLNYIGVRTNSGTVNSANNHDIGAGGEVAAYTFYNRSTAASNITSNMYGVIGAVYNAGPGTIKGLYGRAIAETGCTGVIVGGVLGANTVPGINIAAGLQMTFDTDSGRAVDYAIWITSVTATTTKINYGILLQDVAVQPGGAGFQMSAKGTGDFLVLKNAAGNANLFAVNSLGKISSIAGIMSDVYLDSQVVLALQNDVRSYQLQAITTGDYFRILAGAIGDILRIESNGNTGIFGFSSFGGGIRVLGLPNASPPSGAPVGGGVVYVEAGALKYRGSSGTITVLGVA